MELGVQTRRRRPPLPPSCRPRCPSPSPPEPRELYPGPLNVNLRPDHGHTEIPSSPLSPSDRESSFWFNDIAQRTQALPKELRDMVFQDTIIAALPDSLRSRNTMPPPYPDATPTYLCQFLNQFLDFDQDPLSDDGHKFAEGTLYVARMFELFELFAIIPQSLFERWIGPSMDSVPDPAHYGLLKASGILRIFMLSRECARARRSPFSSWWSRDSRDRFIWITDSPSMLCMEDLPTFLWYTVTNGFSGEVKDGEWAIAIDDGEVQAVIVVDNWRSYTWLSKRGGAWTFTEQTATLKVYDEYAFGGIVEWKLENAHFEVEFSNLESTAIDEYLRVWDSPGLLKANQARNDVELDRKEEIEALRSTVVAAMSKKERCEKTACEGRFWPLA